MEAVFQLILATIFGALVGLERGIKRKEAGLQTYSLVTLSTCLFTIISFELFNIFFNKTGISFDPSRIIMAIAVGIGFIGGRPPPLALPSALNFIFWPLLPPF